ncbi:MAG: trehalose phosphatase, partial [Cyanobacteria bacterium SZAS LIN-5]|nr:trehalose phosphatase [Cyanobacteria bacterium SZAS LIN-5]
NGNNFALLPPFLSKERAVEYFLRELAPPHDCLIGIGDSRSDLGFMALCDYVVTPTRSQIFAMLTGSQSSERT